MMKAVLACISAALLVVSQQADARTVFSDVIDYTPDSNDLVGTAFGAEVALGVSNDNSAVTRELLAKKKKKKKKGKKGKKGKKKGKKEGAALPQSRRMLSTSHTVKHIASCQTYQMLLHTVARLSAAFLSQETVCHT
jgi:predicted transposase YdaD